MPFSAQKFILLNCTDSTNNYAMRLIRKGDVQDGTAIFALEQESGKGRLGRTWQSEPGSNLIMSVITQMQGVLLKNQFHLSMIASITVARLLEIHSKLKVFVKWPNDIFINDKKAGGILIENIIQGQNWQWAVTGFGININQKSFGALETATSLAIENGHDTDILRLANSLQKAFLENVNHWKHQNQSFLNTYTHLLYKRNEVVSFQTGNTVFRARIKGVTTEGKLITEDHNNPSEKEWRLNEIKMITDALD